MRISLLFLFLSIAALWAESHAPQTPPPKIDYRLQFEVRTLEAQILRLESQARKLADKVEARVAEMRSACGASFSLIVDSETGEFRCVVVAPEASRPQRPPHE